jgi:hypothetical protein
MVKKINPPVGITPPIFFAQCRVITVNNMQSLQSTSTVNVDSLPKH